VSVTYAEQKNQKDNSIQRELLNAAFVAIPANPEAVVLSSKSVDKADGGMSASGDNPDVKHDDMVQAIHDAACHLGAQCANEIEADPGTADGANKSLLLEGVVPRAGIPDGFSASIKSSSTKDAGSPQESPDDSPAEAATKAAADAPAEVPAEAAEKSADDTAPERRAARARSLAFLTKQSSFRSNHAQ
jgi:hypothetical protein